MNNILLTVAFHDSCFIVSMNREDLDVVRPNLMTIRSNGLIETSVATSTITSKSLEELVTKSMGWFLDNQVLPSKDYIILVSGFFPIGFYEDLIDKVLTEAKPVCVASELRH